MPPREPVPLRVLYARCVRSDVSSCVVALALGACAASTRRAPLEASFAQPADASAAVQVVIAIHDSPACTDASQWSTVVTRDGSAAMPPSLPAHTYGVSAAALDASCHVVAEVCTAVDLASASRVSLVLVSADRPCAGDECAACRDAGAMPDVGAMGDASAMPDAGTMPDTGAVDAYVPTTDACTTTENCRNGIDDDCDGLADCDDGDCAARPICTTGCTPMPCP